MNSRVRHSKALIVFGAFCAILATLTSFAFAATIEEVQSYDSVYPSLSNDDILILVSQGDELAQHEYANRLATGSGDLPVNQSAAAMWYSKAAQRGYPGAASLDSLPNAPIRVDKTRPNQSSTAPTAVLSIQPTGGQNRLSFSVFGNQSSDAQGISRYLWRAGSTEDESVAVDVTNLGSGNATITFPSAGSWFVTLIVVNQAGLIDQQTVTQTIQPPTAPLLLHPSANSLVQTDRATTFTWAENDLASSYDFELFTRLENSEIVPIIGDQVPLENCSENCSVNVAISADAGTQVFWRVRTRDETGASAWTESSVIMIGAATATPQVPMAIAPINNSDLIANSVATFQWHHEPQVEYYEFHYYDNDPAGPRGARLPGITNLYAHDLCDLGICSFSNTVDLSEFEQHAWRVRAINSLGTSGWSRSTFNAVAFIENRPPAATLLTPSFNAPIEHGERVLFSWLRADTATAYQFQLFDLSDDSFEGPTSFIRDTSCGADSCTLWLDLDFPISQQYRWQVIASNAAGETVGETRPLSLITIATQAPVVVENIAPAVNAQLAAGATINFEWNRDEHVVTYDFHFYDNIRRDISSSYLDIVAADICDDTLCTFSTSVDVSEGVRHAWRVRGKNSLGTSSWSRSSFDATSTVIEPPAPFALISPSSNESVVQNSSVLFQWHASARADEYAILLSDINGSNDAIVVATLAASFCSSTLCNATVAMSYPASENYAWSVRAINSVGEITTESNAMTIVDPATIPPTSPIALAPSIDDVVLTESTVAFQWSSSGSGSITSTHFDFYIEDGNSVTVHSQSDLDADAVCTNDVCTLEIDATWGVDANMTWYVRAKRDDLISEWTSTLFSVTENVTNEAPEAHFSISGTDSNNTGTLPLSVVFDPSASTDDIDIVTYRWDFGDGSDLIELSSDETQSHVFTQAGTFSATLTVFDEAGLSDVFRLNINVTSPITSATAIEASRLLSQASFGPSRTSLAEVQARGIENWIDHQLTLEGPAHLDYVSLHSNGSGRGPRHDIWWGDAVDGEDQLRQRVAFALSQILVVSDTGFTLANAQYGITNYYDILRRQAFGNYRELLEEVTLSPVMGLYLSMLQNARGNPEASTRADENYAREILQLFSIGLHELNLDGSTDGTPSFTQAQIEAFARVFTGWNYADAGRWNRLIFTGADLINPMLPFEEYHDTDEKILLNGVVAPAGNSARQDLEIALDNIFAHDNVGPFISKQLIKKLVTSNPSPEYVARVSSVFNDDGAGVKGNLGAVVKAILMDEEARNIPDFNAYGKLREPVLRLSHLWRAFNIQPGTSTSTQNEYNTVSPPLENLESVTGQAVLRSPSVFNFFQPSFSPAGPVADLNLVAPEFELFTESNELATSNRIGRQIQDTHAGNPFSNGQATSYLDFSYEIELANDSDALLDHLNILLLSGNMSENLESALRSHLASFSDTDDGRSQAVRDVVTLIMASPDYLVQM